MRLTRHPPKHSPGTLKVDNLVDKNVFRAGTSGVINAGTQNPPLVPPELKLLPVTTIPVREHPHPAPGEELGERHPPAGNNRAIN